MFEVDFVVDNNDEVFNKVSNGEEIRCFLQSTCSKEHLRQKQAQNHEGLSNETNKSRLQRQSLGIPEIF